MNFVFPRILPTLTPGQEERAHRGICPTCRVNSLTRIIISYPFVSKQCHLCNHIVMLSYREPDMKYKAGDRVRIIKREIEARVIDLSGTKEHPYYVEAIEGKDAEGFYAETDLEPSKVVDIPLDLIDTIIYTLHTYGTERQPHSFGLPIYNETYMNEMREKVRAAVYPPVPALPERREQTRIFTDLDKQVAEDAQLFEEQLGYHPARIPSTVYPWGWAYDSKHIQEQFRNYCTTNKK